MSAAYAFFRLLWRWATLFNLLIVASMATVAGVVEMAFSGSLLWWTRARSQGVPLADADVDVSFPTGHALSLAVLLAPAALGMIVADPIQGLQYTPQSWTLPRRRKLFVPALAVGVVVALGVAAVHVTYGGPMSFVVATALALFGFTLGTLLWDTARPGWIVWGAPALLVAGFFAIENLGSTAWTAPLAFAGACGLALLWTLESDARTKAMLPSNRLSVSFRPTASLGDWSPSPSDRAAARARWPIEHIGSSMRGWVRAATYEQNGWRRLGGVAAGLVAVLVGLLFLFLIAFQDGFEAEGTLAMGLRFAHGTLFEIEFADLQPSNEPPYYGVGIVTSAVLAVMCLGTPILLGRRRLYPLSRRQRARVDWWSQLVQLAIGLALLLAGFAVTSELVHRLGGFEQRGHALPGYVRAALLGAALMPAFQWAHVRWLRPVRQTATTCSLIAGVIVGGFVLAIGAGNALWRDHLLELPALSQLGLLLTAAVLAQLVYRARLASWYARADLV